MGARGEDLHADEKWETLENRFTSCHSTQNAHLMNTTPAMGKHRHLYVPNGIKIAVRKAGRMQCYE